MTYYVIYDGNCNLCISFTQLLAQFDQGQLFNYIRMQDEKTLQHFGITPQDCQWGVILLNDHDWGQRWQGTAAIEEIITLLPLGEAFITAYRAVPGLKWLSDRTYAQVRDHRYAWFGSPATLHEPPYPVGCLVPTSRASEALELT
jgi:predicted DCC family thiol-disulfide oxidoreductase YuxK